MGPKAGKVGLRREFVARILSMDRDDRREQQATLERRFPSLPGLDRARTIMLYASAFPEEVETEVFCRHVLEAGRHLVLPTVDRLRRTLRLAEVTDLSKDLSPGHRGIPEPRDGLRTVEASEVDWVLAPGLAFDEEANRLGRGAGYYDRLLPALRAEVPRWALIFSTQWVDRLPVEPHDQVLDGVADCRRVVLGDRGLDTAFNR